MLLLGIGIGCVAGVIFAAIGFLGLTVGTIKTKQDPYDGDVYLYVELNERGRYRLTKRDYVVMRVDHSQQ